MAVNTTPMNSNTRGGAAIDLFAAEGGKMYYIPRYLLYLKFLIN